MSECGPPREGRCKEDLLFAVRMDEGEVAGMQAEGRIGWRMRLCIADLTGRQIALLSEDGPAELPEVEPDLVGATSRGTSFYECGAIFESLPDKKVGAGGQALFVDRAAAEFSGRAANRRIAAELILWRMTLNSG